MSRIPKRLKVVLRNKIGYRNSYNGEKYKCRPAFVTDADGNPNTLERAKDWAKNHWGPGKTGAEDPEVVEKDNKPFTGLRLVDVELRSEGGKAWKVLTPERWLVDLREDVFMPILFREGLPTNRNVGGTFIWAVYGSQMRLVEVGSKLHKEILEEEKARASKTKAKRLPTKDLVIGGVYSGSVQGSMVYLGRVRHKGKLKFAWVCISWKDKLDTSLLQLRFDEAMNKLLWIRKGDIRGAECIVTGSYTYTEMDGKVDVGDFRDKIIIYTDGYGCARYDDEVEWV